MDSNFDDTQIINQTRVLVRSLSCQSTSICHTESASNYARKLVRALSRQTSAINFSDPTNNRLVEVTDCGYRHDSEDYKDIENRQLIEAANNALVELSPVCSQTRPNCIAIQLQLQDTIHELTNSDIVAESAPLYMPEPFTATQFVINLSENQRRQIYEKLKQYYGEASQYHHDHSRDHQAQSNTLLEELRGQSANQIKKQAELKSLRLTYLLNHMNTPISTNMLMLLDQESYDNEFMTRFHIIKRCSVKLKGGELESVELYPNVYRINRLGVLQSIMDKADWVNIGCGTNKVIIF